MHAEPSSFGHDLTGDASCGVPASISGIEASGCPAGIALREPDAIVEAVASPSPEFEGDRNEAEAFPMGWSKHRSAFEARGHGIDLEKQGLTIRERLRLPA